MRALTELKKQCFIEIGRTNCLCCNESRPKRLLVHHLSYTKDSVTYSGRNITPEIRIKFSNDDYGRLKYYSNLLDEILEDKDNFIVICFKCHTELEELLRLQPVEVLELFKHNKSKKYRFMKSYSLTLKKRGIELPWADPIDVVVYEPQLFSCIGGLMFINKLELKITIKKIFESIESKTYSLEDISQKVSFNHPTTEYINDQGYYHLNALYQLETVMDISKLNNIKFVRILNKPYVKPIELARIEEIDSVYYLEYFERLILDKELLDKTELDIIVGRPTRSGLDEFFRS